MPAAIPIAAAAVSAYGAIKSSQNNKEAAQTSTTQNKLDPRSEEILYGSNGQNGLLSQFQNLINTPQSQGLQAAGNAANNYIGSQSNNVIDQITSGANRLMQERNPAYSSNVNPTSAAEARAATAQGNMPSQNNIDLGGAYNQFIYGNSAENPYLTGAIQKGINQGMEAFGNLQSDATRNLTEAILPNIRGGAIASGQYGGSRQGLSESKAVNDFSTQIGRAAQNVGRGAIDSAISAQAGAYDAGQNRGLSALGSLGGQQYGSASQVLGNQQQANMQNAQNRQQNAQYYSGLNQNNNQFNANSADRQSQLNSQNLMAGMGSLQNLYNTNYGMAQNSQNYDINRAQQANGLLAPYLSANGSIVNTQPMYQNTTANALGAGVAGYQMGNQIMNMWNRPSSDYQFTGTPTTNYSQLPNTFTFGGN